MKWLVTYYLDGRYGYLAVSASLTNLVAALAEVGLDEAHLIRVDAL